jgi:dolichol-phosphate mannosyltransferase/undecaprenyl-phosphate 4-deoxy-4-formamido-L-arabinose transferase
MADAAHVEFSVLVSCHFEEKTIDEFHQRLSKTLQALGRPYEIVFVNDGSTDGTYARLDAIFDRDPHVTAIVDLMKNSGQSNAKTPGVMLARGRAFVMMDSDLQLDPEDLPRLVAAWDAGCDVVSGYREHREDPLVRAFQFGPFKPWRPVPVISMAQRIVEVPVGHHPRRHGRSGWTFSKLFSYNMENLVNVSDRPFQLLGSAFLFLASLFILRLAAEFIFDLKILPRVTTGLLLNAMVVSLLVTLGVLSIVGELVIRNFLLLQGKPAFVVRRQRRRDPS